jgi:hypothetical protein
MALDRLDARHPVRAEIQECMASHEERVCVLRETIVALGGTPTASSGRWGAFAKAFESAATVFGDRAAVAALEDGEDHGLIDYRGELDEPDLDMQSKTIVTWQLLPAQQTTHERIRALKHRMKS